MKSNDYFSMFMETGAPELYLMYQQTRRLETENVLEDSGPGAAGCKL